MPPCGVVCCPDVDLCVQVLVAYYQQQRQCEERSQARTTIRMLESLVRVSQVGDLVGGGKVYVQLNLHKVASSLCDHLPTELITIAAMCTTEAQLHLVIIAATEQATSLHESTCTCLKPCCAQVSAVTTQWL